MLPSTLTCRPSEGRPPQAIQARHQPDVAGAPSERLAAGLAGKVDDG
jgi:hypothetical protein